MQQKILKADKVYKILTEPTGTPEQVARTIARAIHHQSLSRSSVALIRQIALASKAGDPAAREIMKHFTHYVYQSGAFCPAGIVKISEKLNLIINNNY